MLGNGDERQQAAWEGVEAKLDRLAEIVGDMAGTLGREPCVELVAAGSLNEDRLTSRDGTPLSCTGGGK